MPSRCKCVCRTVGCAVGCVLIWVASLAAQHQPRPTRAVYLIDFEGGSQKDDLGDLAAFATTTLRLRLSNLKSLKYLSSQSQTPCRQSMLAGSRKAAESGSGSATVPMHYVVSGSVNLRSENGQVPEIDLSYSLDQVEGCQVKSLIQTRVPMAPADALSRFRNMSDLIALRLEEELSDRIPVVAEAVVTTSSDEQTRDAARLLQQVLEGRLADSEDFRSASAAPAGNRSPYRLSTQITTKTGAKGPRVESVKFHIEADSKPYDLPAEIAPTDQSHAAMLDFYGDAAESVLREMAEIRYRRESGLPDDPAQVETSLAVSKASTYLSQGKASAALALFSGLPPDRQLPPDALEMKARALFETGDFPAAAKDYDQAAALSNVTPKFQARALFAGAAAWYRAGQYSMAADRYASVIKLVRAPAPDPEFQKMLRDSARWRMTSLGQTGQTKQALTEYVEVLPIVNDRTGLDKEAQALLNGVSSIQTLRELMKVLAPLGTDSPVLQNSWQRIGDDLYATHDYVNARQFYQYALSSAQKQTPPDQAQIARLMSLVGNALSESSHGEEAIPYYESAIQTARAGGSSEAGALVAYLRNLALTYENLGAPEKAKPVLLDAKTTVESAYGATSPEAAAVDVQLGNLYTDWGKLDKADPLLTGAVSVLEKQSPRNDTELFGAYVQLGWLRWEMQNIREAAALFRKAQAILDARNETGTFEYGSVLDHLASAYGAEGNYSQALSLQKKAVAIMNTIGSPQDAADRTFNLCISFINMELYEDAASECKKVQDSYKRLYGPQHWMYAYATLALAEIRSAQAMFPLAEKLYEEGYRLYDASPAKSPRRLLEVRRMKARLRYNEGYYEEALTIADESLKAMMQLPGDNELRVADTQQLRGWILLRLGRPQARDAFLSVVSSYEARSLPDHPTASSSREGLGRLAFAKGDLVSAQDFCQRSLQNYLKSYGYDSEDVADSLDCLGMVSTARGDYQTAAGQFQRALKAYENTFGPKHPKIAETLDHYAVVLKATGDVAQSASLTERAAAIRASFKAP